MKILRNATAILSEPALAWEFLCFELSRVQHGGEIVRQLRSDQLEIGGLSGFSEYHSCVNFVSPAERQFLTQVPLGDGAIIDVGANLGILSLMLARRFPARLIHAFEPNPSAFKAMVANFNRNRCSNLRPHPQAIANYDGEISFLADPVNRATNHIALNHGGLAQTAPVLKVPCLTLDSFAEQQSITKISLLKVDVEGHEKSVFHGANGLLAARRIETIYYEVCPQLSDRAGFAPDEAGRHLLEHGYRLHTLNSRGKLEPVSIDGAHSVFLENWIAALPESI